MPDPYTPTTKDRFTFGLWTVGHRGHDPFGRPTRPSLAPAEIVDLLGEVGGVHGVNFHDNDLVPIDATDEEAEQIKREFATGLKRNKLRVAMATCDLFSDPAFKDGAFTSHDAEVRAYAIQKSLRAMDLGAEFGAEVYVLWGGREGADFDAGKDPVEAIAHLRTAIDFLCGYAVERGYPYKFALEAKPNEPRGSIFMPTTAAYLALIPTLAHPELVGVNPEVAHEHMAGLNFTHAVAQALEAGKLYHIDLNDQAFGRYDQDLRFGADNPKAAFHLVRLLEQHKYEGFKHFDAHAVRTSDREDVIAFARGCMRTYLILKEKARLWAKDSEVKRLLRQLSRGSKDLDELMSACTLSRAETLLGMTFDRDRLAARRLPLEALDQRTTEILLGI